MWLFRSCGTYQFGDIVFAHFYIYTIYRCITIGEVLYFDKHSWFLWNIFPPILSVCTSNDTFETRTLWKNSPQIAQHYFESLQRAFYYGMRLIVFSRDQDGVVLFTQWNQLGTNKLARSRKKLTITLSVRSRKFLIYHKKSMCQCDSTMNSITEILTCLSYYWLEIF